MAHGSEAAPRPGTGPGEVDYRLARHALIAAYRNGEVDEGEICDAHPELQRAAVEVGRPSEVVCPICAQANLVTVLYVFGPRLPAFGRCVTTAKEIEDIATRAGNFTGYEVEVCCRCWWNHLGRTFPVGSSEAVDD